MVKTQSKAPLTGNINWIQTARAGAIMSRNEGMKLPEAMALVKGQKSYASIASSSALSVSGGIRAVSGAAKAKQYDKALAATTEKIRRNLVQLKDKALRIIIGEENSIILKKGKQIGIIMEEK